MIRCAELLSMRRVLVIERRYLVARSLCSQLARYGLAVAGFVPAAEYALPLLQDAGIDVVLLSDEARRSEAGHALLRQLEHRGAQVVNVEAVLAALDISSLPTAPTDVHIRSGALPSATWAMLRPL